MSDAIPATKISSVIDARQPSEVPLDQTDSERLALLYRLPILFAEESDIRSLYNLIMTKVVEVIPGAKRGALLVYDPDSNKLALRSSIPYDDPPVSRTLVKKAASGFEGFIWSVDDEINPSMSIVELGLKTGMYAPLVWKGAIMGVLSVDNPCRGKPFSPKDLQFLMSVAHYAAAAVQNHILQVDLERNATTMEHLLANFSPSLRQQLLSKAKMGELEPGGEKSDVTLLMSDIRGFTKLTEGMDSAEVVEMLNEYFSALVDAIFEHNGTVDKFIGDAILAVFGSPEPDEHQSLNALKAAISMQRAVARINKSRESRGVTTCHMGIGLHCGEVLHGFIGGKERLEFTVIGETVTRTSRYCDGADGDQIVVSSALYQRLERSTSAIKIAVETKHEGSIEAFQIQFKP